MPLQLIAKPPGDPGKLTHWPNLANIYTSYVGIFNGVIKKLLAIYMKKRSYFCNCYGWKYSAHR